ncbi:hypothetical protein Halha_2158 [Halobacteroides halobius DSM 5150]|uniref:Uncharacterized protein n=1 Tax=Halobacteroides halobius (strain ATCC 35273 / DSM 5150 / MD-1) TaxID=748449 RepID=L0KAJ9_HALHC|nr:hypothetical protein [Halobacteroides halobius]AGB42041.1 hypothetical protein Halha_2158 [Halobacteroides halobius DSM 5150]
MLTSSLIFYGSTANKIRSLKNDTNLFERFLDVYIVGGVVGMLFNSKEEEKRDKNKVTIFAEQLQNERMRIKYLSSLAFLIENNDNSLEKDKLLKQTFSDWFANTKNEVSEENQKYDLFKSYAIGGIDILHSEIIGESTDKDAYLRNYYDFIKKIENEQIDNSADRAIISALMS